ncbi:MAG: hypothetical protein QHG99_09000, partial [Methanomicrobiales archaeon]|nr:hypothetical protein [Methanomicrobiales archaeon]
MKYKEDLLRGLTHTDISSGILKRPMTFFLIGVTLWATVALVSGLQPIGHVSNGPSFAILSTGGFVYAAQGSEVRVYDIRDPSKIPQLGWQNALARIYVGSEVRGLDTDGRYLYVAGVNDFLIVDISRPDDAHIVSRVNNINGSIRDVRINGNYAYIASQKVGIITIDVADRSNPVVLHNIRLDAQNKPWRMTVRGGYLYTGMEGENRLNILSLSDPSEPVMAGFYNRSGDDGFSGVDVYGRYAVVS